MFVCMCVRVFVSLYQSETLKFISSLAKCYLPLAFNPDVFHFTFTTRTSWHQQGIYFRLISKSNMSWFLFSSQWPMWLSRASAKLGFFCVTKILYFLSLYFRFLCKIYWKQFWFKLLFFNWTYCKYQLKSSVKSFLCVL